MKTILSFCLIVIFSNNLFSQAGTVSLKTADGTLVGTYTSLGSAYAAIPGTVTTGYIIEFLNGYIGNAETFPISLTAKEGLSDDKRIIIRPSADVTNILISANLNSPVIILDGADFITFDGRPGGLGDQIHLKIQNMNSTGSSAHTIRLINGALKINFFIYIFMGHLLEQQVQEI